MVRAFVGALAAALLGSVACDSVRGAATSTPVEKVIDLLEDLKAEVVHEGKEEATTYETFACFCKSKTVDKTEKIGDTSDTIDGLAATMQEQTELAHEKVAEMKEFDEEIAEMDKDMTKLTARREKEKVRYEATMADLDAGVESIDTAIADLEAFMPPTSFAQVKAPVRQALLMADVLGLVNPEVRSHVASFLDVGDPSSAGDAAAGHDMQAGAAAADVIETLKKLKEGFAKRRAERENIEAQNARDYAEQVQAKNDEKKSSLEAIDVLKVEKAAADEAVAEASDALLLERVTLADDEVYIKDLTERCEAKAREWDQRSKMRADEVAALTQALSIIRGKVQDADAEVNQRAAFLESFASPFFVNRPVSQEEAPVSELASVDLAFIQLDSNPRKRLMALAKKGTVKEVARTVARSHFQRRSDQPVRSREDVLASLAEKARALKSPVLSSLAIKMSANPFLKVRKLIQGLMERLTEEAAEESTKKGWCDTEMAKATRTRDNHMHKVMNVDAQIKGLEATKHALEDEVKTLTEELADLLDETTKQTKIRSEEHAENLAVLDKAKEGHAAVKKARGVLQDFYKNSAKSKVSSERYSLLQGASTSASTPVDANVPGAELGGAYKGGQQKSKGIIAMLDVIVSDFERTIKVTTESEKESAQEFVKFERTTKTSIATKETRRGQCELELKDTDQKLSEGMEDLDQHQRLLDDALKTLEDLRPSCVDTGMSYAERVAKREEEIAALKQAMCSLDEGGVEDACQ